MTTSDYWHHKLGLFLHDPVHKALDIAGHERRAADIAHLLDVALPEKTAYQAADMIASALSRASLPGYDRDDTQNGAVDFSRSAVLTHPLVAEQHLDITQLLAGTSADRVHSGLRELLTKDLGLGMRVEEFEGLAVEERPLSGFFNRKSHPEEWARALYLYLFFALPGRMREENVGGIGPAWEVMPADSRMPDNSIWHHMALTSAVGSCIRQSPSSSVGMGVFTISPVQPFISKARKLRDHWVASVILSYLSFCGLRYLAEELGPDHIVYPSLQDQELVEVWLRDRYHLSTLLPQVKRGGTSGVASLPNRFVFLCPEEELESTAAAISQAVRDGWRSLAQPVFTLLRGWSGGGDSMHRLFFSQVEDYWRFSWAGCRLLAPDVAEQLDRLLHPDKWVREKETIGSFAAPYGMAGQASARLYGATHSLVQALHAATKSKPDKLKEAQHGIKCPLCGEHEILHDHTHTGDMKVADYRGAIDGFWESLRSRANSTTDNYAQIGEKEQLCAVCLIKRFLPQAVRLDDGSDPALRKVLEANRTFPSTTEMAANRYLQELASAGLLKPGDPEYRTFLDHLHNLELSSTALDAAEEEGEEKLPLPRRVYDHIKDSGIEYRNSDKYYAVLLMDGDRMGALINGQSITARWRDVIHPELCRKFEEASFQPRATLRPVLDQVRLQNPALHARISSALNSFARFSVAPSIRHHNGQLIYAGGDDVCAVLPTDTALEAAAQLQREYRMAFVDYHDDGVRQPAGDMIPTRLGLHLGSAPAISISAAILIAHQKVPLREVVADAHAVLDGIAKNRAGRNGLAIRLKKRSGGDRDMWLQWDETNKFRTDGGLLIDDFLDICKRIRGGGLSTSLIYRLVELGTGLRAILTSEADVANKIRQITAIIEYELRHSGVYMGRGHGLSYQRTAKAIAGLMIRASLDDTRLRDNWFQPDAAVIAGFLAHGRQGEEI